MTASLKLQRLLNEQWEKEFYPLVHNIFQKDATPTAKGEYVVVTKRRESTHRCDLESIKLKDVEVACHPYVNWPLKLEEVTALFEGGKGQQQAFESLRRQMLQECCNALKAAGYQPKTTTKDDDKTDLFEQFLNGVAELYKNEIYAGLTMSEIIVLPTDDIGHFSDDPEEHRDPTIGFVAYLTMRLWVKVNTNDNPTN